MGPPEQIVPMGPPRRYLDVQHSDVVKLRKVFGEGVSL
jgi:hypothetical protein